jgi:glycosyltransferase involved in cell wall biosynthesis
MRILTVVFDLQKGGTQRAAQNFAEAYHAAGHDSRVWAPETGGVREEELRTRGVPCWIGRGPQLFEQIRGWNPEVIHLHSLLLNHDDVIRTLKSCPSAAVVETNVFSIPSPWVDQVDVSFQLSRWCEWLYLARGGPPERTAVVPYPVRTGGFRRASPDAVEAFRRSHCIGRDEILLGRIGQSYERKWSPLLLDAFEHVRRTGIPAKLLVVNAPTAVLARCERSPYAADVIFVREIIGDEAISVAYSAMDVFVHVADQGESFGLVLTEAMLCETPVAVFSTPWEDNSQPEVVGNRVGGLVATTRKGFLNAVVRLCRDEPLRRRLGGQGRERVLDRYDSAAVARLALAHACKQPGSTRSSTTVKDVLAMYKDAVDTPSHFTTAVIGRFQRLQLPRYTTGYQPWSSFAIKCMKAAGRRLGLRRASVESAES